MIKDMPFVFARWSERSMIIVTIKDFILRSTEHDPLTEAAAQKKRKRILQLQVYSAPKELSESKEQDP